MEKLSELELKLSSLSRRLEEMERRLEALERALLSTPEAKTQKNEVRLGYLSKTIALAKREYQKTL